MKKNLVALAVALGLGAAFVPTPADAAPVFPAPVTYCSPAALQVCAAFSAATDKVSGVWHLYLRVWNAYDGTAANGLSHAITFAGIGSSWSGTASLVSATFNGQAVGWQESGSGIPNNVVGAELDFASNTDNGINQGLVGCTQPIPPGQFQTCLPNGPELDLDFTTDTKFALTDAVYGWHSQGINSTTCSLWVDSNGNTTADNTADCAPTVVPEPFSVALLATGLAGLGGAGLFRRRGKKILECEGGV